MLPGDIIDLFQELEAAYSDRNAQIGKNRDYVLSTQWDQAALDDLPLGVKPMTVNYCHPIVLKNVTFLVGRSPEIGVPLAEDNPEARSYAEFIEKVLYGVWEANRLQRRFQDMAWNCSVAGGQPVLVDWDPVARRVVWTTPAPERVYTVSAMNDDALNTEAVCAELFFSPFYLAKRFGGSPKSWHTDFSEGGLEYVTVIRYSDAHGSKWVQRSNGRLLDERSGYGFVPYVYVPNIPVPGGIDGLADVTLLRPMQDHLNRLITNQAALVEMHADPPIIMEGTAVDPVSVDWGPGLRLPIEAGGKVYYLQWEGTPPDFRDQITTAISAMQDLSGIPDVAFGRYEASIQSGIALNTQFQPTRLLMSVKQNAWSDAFAELHRMSLELMRTKMGDAPIEVFGTDPRAQTPFALQINPGDLTGYCRSELIWPGMLPKDDASEQQQILNQYAAGAISLYTLLEKLGHESPSEEINRIKEEFSDAKLHPERVVDQTAAPSAGGGAGGVDSQALLASMGLAGMPGGGGMNGAAGMPAGIGSQSANQMSEEAYANRTMPGLE